MKKAIVCALIILAIFLLGFYCLPKPPLLDNTDYSQAVFSNDHQLLRLTLSKDQQFRIYTPLNKIAKTLQQATLLQEDRYYYQHWGINPIALLKGFWTSYISKQRLRGASTITMQIARMRYHLHTKTILGKLQQIYYAIALERYYNKQQLLQAYLNLAPYGGNIEGVGAASLIYFHKQPNELTLAQALILAVIPQNPVKRQPKQNADNPALEQARQRLFRVWSHKYTINRLQKISMSLPLQVYGRHQLPFLAPHFVNYVLQHDTKKYWLQTTLNLDWQQLFTQQTQQFVQQRKNRGISNAAALLIDTNTMAIKAMQGSADFANKFIHGQVNAATARRSPGSTLKPFIYALAIQHGLITPKSMLMDLPLRYQTYQPENMDANYFGPIAADQALIMSRNIPALALNQRLGEHDLYNILQLAGIKNLKNKSHYGLSLVLGGAELSMLELAKLYASLNNRGLYKPIRILHSQPETIGKKILSPEASFITLSMLQQHASINKIDSNAWIKPTLTIAWKTGTSSGNRDAWAVAVFSHYVLVVWVGDFQAKSNSVVTGRQAAAPLLFQLITALTNNNRQIKNSALNTADLNIKQMQVCTASGMLATTLCKQQTSTWFIPGVSPIKKDTVYRLVAINKQSGLQTCRPDKNTIYKVYEFWPSAVQQYFRQAGIKRDLPPEFESGCDINDLANNITIDIESPMNNQVYYLTAHNKIIPLIAKTSQATSQIYWFADTQFLGISQANQALFWQAQPGEHTIQAISMNGAAAEVHITVTAHKISTRQVIDLYK